MRTGAEYVIQVHESIASWTRLEEEAWTSRVQCAIVSGIRTSLVSVPMSPMPNCLWSEDMRLLAWQLRH